MNRIFQSYYDIIKQQGQEQPKSFLQDPKPRNAQLIFSAQLATQFSNTINQFTTICAKIIQKRTVGQKTKDKFDELYGKIKSLVDAAAKSADLNKIR